MKLEGIHHVTAITGDAPQNLDFYTRVLGLRLVKKTVNQDDPTVYHLFYADEQGSPGADLTFFEYPGAAPGRAGAGMVHRIGWRVGLDGGARLLGRAAGRGGRGRRARRGRAALPRPRGPRARAGGLDRRRRAADRRPPRGAGRARAAGLRLRARLLRRPRRQPRPAGGRARLRAAARTGGRSAGSSRGGLYAYDAPPGRAGRARRGHRAPRGVRLDDGRARGRGATRAIEGGARPTEVIDRFWFSRSTSASPAACCSRSPRWGPASPPTRSPSTWARSWCCRRKFEPMREQIEATVTPLENPRARRRERELDALAPHPARRGRAGGRARADARARRPTRTTCSRCSTCSTPSGGCWASPPRGPLSAAARRTRTGTWCSGSASPTRRRSTPPTRSSRGWLDGLLAEHGIDHARHGARRLLAGHGDGVLRGPRRGTARGRRASSR